MLVFVNLLAFDHDKLVPNVLNNVQLAVGSQDMGDHLVVMRFQKLEQILSGEIKELVLRDCHFELIVLLGFGNDPAVVHKFSSVLQIWIHNHRHEVILVHHASEYGFQVIHLNLFFSLLAFNFFSCLGNHILLESIVQ